MFGCLWFLVISIELTCIFAEISQCSEDTLTFIPSEPKCSPSDYCYGTDNDKRQATFFSTKTAYRTAQRTRQQSHDEFNISNCIASNIFLLIRHGTRLPPASDITRFSQMERFRDTLISNINRLSDSPLCRDDLESLKQWKWNHRITVDQACDLVSEGHNELRSIAQNYQRFLPNLFDQNYDPTKFHFRHTDRLRTRDSFRSFVDGLFGDEAHKQINAAPSPHQPDLLLKAYEHCNRWQQRKQSLKLPDSEGNKYENSDHYQNMIKEIDSRFGFNNTLNVNDVKNIFNLCRYEQAWNISAASGWCSLLTPSQIRILEYREDLSYYYKSSHGSEVNKNIQCETVKDMLLRLESNDLPKVTAYFTHSAALQLFLTALGALKDDNAPTADNFIQMSTRKWKTSIISPFAGNIAIVKYECPTETKIKLFLNEETLKLDWCSSDGTCDWTEMQAKYTIYKNAQCENHFCNIL